MATKLDGLFTPGGRLVMGSLTEKGDKDYEDKPIPEDKQRYFFGVAVPKDAPGVSELINSLWFMAATDYAQVPLVMNQINLGLAAKDFAWKIQDGDAPIYDKKTGQLKTTPEYLLGCYIFKFSTQFEFDACDNNGVQIARSDIKNGDYVDVMFNSSVNGKIDDNAGIYLNPLAIRRLGFGKAIATGVSAAQAFAGRAAVAPAGATTMPTASGAMPGASMPGNGVAQGQPQMGVAAGMPGAGMPGAGQIGQTASPTNPHTAILNGPVGGGMPGMGR